MELIELTVVLINNVVTLLILYFKNKNKNNKP